MPRPVIRVLRHMARSGGTVISRCLGSMDSVLLLSEIHPAGTHVFDPLSQAGEWFGLLSQDEVQAWSQNGGEAAFADVIATVERRASQRGSTLVIREWSHLDVIGRPHREPGFRFELGEALRQDFAIVDTFTVRHPIDQYLSLIRLEALAGMTIDEYLRGCRVFAEWAHEGGFVRFEDFTANPDEALLKICDRLWLPFDPSYRVRWSSYATITGDTRSDMRGRMFDAEGIRPLQRRPAHPGLVADFRSRDDYHRTIALLGYPDE